MEKLVLHTLTANSVIMESDIERRVIDVLGCGFDRAGRLVIAVDHIDEEDPRNECSLSATIERCEAYALARRLDTSLTRLPAFIAECMEEWRRLRYPDPEDVRDCFKEITECLIDEGCRFRLSRTIARSGYVIN